MRGAGLPVLGARFGAVLGAPFVTGMRTRSVLVLLILGAAGSIHAFATLSAASDGSAVVTSRVVEITDLNFDALVDGSSTWMIDVYAPCTCTPSPCACSAV